MLFSPLRIIANILITISLSLSINAVSQTRLKELARVEGIRENVLSGYGIVVGLAGTGDSSRSHAANQSLLNTLANFGVEIPSNDIRSRNVAAVILTAKLPPFSNRGNKIDVQVSSIGDARSLVGGTLLLAPLYAADNRVYALVQGALTVGGYHYDLYGNLIQKNHTTVGIIPGGAIVEKSVNSRYINENQEVSYLLNNPDFTTVDRVVTAINDKFGSSIAVAENAGKIKVGLPSNLSTVQALSIIENIVVTPDQAAKVVINERTGTVVAGGNVRIDDVTISHGNLKVIISTDYLVSQPVGSGSFNRNRGRTAIVPETTIDVSEDTVNSIELSSGATISELVTSLRQIKTSTRDLITILQALNGAGALRAKLIIQ